MTNKHIKLALPVRLDGDNDLVDTEGFCVAYEGNVAPYNAVMNEVAKCVNYHHRLREALEVSLAIHERQQKNGCTCGLEGECGLCSHVNETRALLTELDNLEDRGHE